MFEASDLTSNGGHAEKINLEYAWIFESMCHIKLYVGSRFGIDAISIWYQNFFTHNCYIVFVNKRLLFINIKFNVIIYISFHHHWCFITLIQSVKKLITMECYQLLTKKCWKFKIVVLKFRFRIWFKFTLKLHNPTTVQ